MVLGRLDREWIEQRVLSAGFDLGGVAGVPESGSPEAAESSKRFAAWVESGRAGEMEFLKRREESGDSVRDDVTAGEFVRGDLRRAFPWARSVIVGAVNYNTEGPRSLDAASPDQGWIARYAWSGRETLGSMGEGAGSDYHDVLLPRLRAVETELKERFGAGCATRCYVDTGPVVERDYAARAGIGWIAKNTCVLNQQQGSWLLLGVIVTSLELAPEAATLPAVDRCGSCTRCLDACPTHALTAPREMDASLCIAYLTIEKKGSIAEELREPMGRQVFGCDICQDVCPWNQRAPVQQGKSLPARKDLINPALGWLASLDGGAFNRWFRGSPLERTRRKRIQRNVAIAMGNSEQAEFVPQLKEWSQGADPVLAEAAEWGLRKLLRSQPEGAADQ